MNNHDLVLVAFGAPWCPWSQKLEPVWLKTAQLIHTKPYAGRVRLGKVDCTSSTAHSTCQKHHIHAFPTIRIFRRVATARGPHAGARPRARRHRPARRGVRVRRAGTGSCTRTRTTSATATHRRSSNLSRRRCPRRDRQRRRRSRTSRRTTRSMARAAGSPVRGRILARLRRDRGAIVARPRRDLGAISAAPTAQARSTSRACPATSASLRSPRATRSTRA